jgi:hypothetical protein
MKFSRKGVERIRAGLRRSWQPGGTHREMQRQRGENADADTLRLRALSDAKGAMLLAGKSPSLGAVVITRSTNRCNQFDVFVEGVKVITGGKRILGDWIASISAENKQ